MDIATFLGLILGVGAIFVGNIIEGGNTSHLVQGAAALIVFGGTFGATLLSFSMRDVFNAFKALGLVFGGSRQSPSEVIEEILGILVKARKMGLIALESEVKNISNPFLRSGLGFVIDGMTPAMIKDVLYQEISTYEEKMKNAADVLGAAGGYAPTIGILGAVLGLIQVMRNVSDPAKIGGGIAVAFVATIYGVGSANLIFLPMARKIMNRVKEEAFTRELIIEGIIGIESGVNPYFLKTRLNAFVSEHDKSE
ncbi:MAG TPA: flagellar motor protein [Nitrospiraceae bacterium]|nr:MAG: flagellar motor protein MotA [Nitrospirae bacterium GWA2_46_11]OGW23152.1 MAG: flagellar motor protein MotA [Nitrospirae bacterium GWB2_47_37]HAK87701.1 flagellar motor protein [Nitrospiraceae bacterium]HCZ12337.1 flagellar motor protein [Nitrospiraceae bacterium]